MLQKVVDEPGFSLVVTEGPAHFALELATLTQLSRHCGHWKYERDKVFMKCGLVIK